jgi:hypothetical protein
MKSESRERESKRERAEQMVWHAAQEGRHEMETREERVLI